MNTNTEKENIKKIFDLLYKAEKDFLIYEENTFKPYKSDILQAIEDEYKTKVSEGIINNAIEVVLFKRDNKKQLEADLVDDLSKEALKNKNLKIEMEKYQNLAEKKRERRVDIKELLNEFLEQNNISIDKDTLKAIQKIAKQKSKEDFKNQNKDTTFEFIYKEVKKIILNKA